jgi:hypothetical protein
MSLYSASKELHIYAGTPTTFSSWIAVSGVMDFSPITISFIA